MEQRGFLYVWEEQQGCVVSVGVVSEQHSGLWCHMQEVSLAEDSVWLLSHPRTAFAWDAHAA